MRDTGEPSRPRHGFCGLGPSWGVLWGGQWDMPGAYLNLLLSLGQSTGFMLCCFGSECCMCIPLGSAVLFPPAFWPPCVPPWATRGCAPTGICKEGTITPWTWDCPSPFPASCNSFVSSTAK